MIRLEKFDESSYDQLISWTRSAEMLMQFAGPAFSYPLTKEQLDLSLSDPNRYAYVVRDDFTGAAMGHAEIYLGENCAFLGRILVADEGMRGKGLGKAIVDQLLEIAFTVLQQSTVALNVFDWNAAAIRCYEKAGFSVDAGKEARREVNGKTWTVIRMKIDKGDWEQATKALRH